MNTDRIKEIQLSTAHPESGSVYTALLKVWNETEQEKLRIGAVRHQLIAYQKWCYEHPEYDQITESVKVDLYLKAINCA